MLNPAKTDLTSAAKSIITNPTFLPENVGEAGALGTAEAGSAAGVFEAAGVLPVLGGSVLAFTAGVGIGTQICGVLGISGCWDFTAGSEKPPGLGDWEFRTSKTEGELATIPAYTWVWSVSPGCGVNCYWRGYGGVPSNECGLTVSANVTSIAHTYVGMKNGSCSKGAATPGTFKRSALQNRTLTYNAKDDPAIGNYSYTAPSKWSENLAAQLKEAPSESAAGRVGQKIASKIGGSGVKDPYPHKVTIPSCSGESWIECKGDLEELELVPERVELDWSDAHLELAPDEVVELAPAPATQVEVPSESKVVVTTNPDESGMPLVVPQPESGETYSHYAARLNPGLSPNRHDLEAAFVDPSVGPNGVVSVEPEPETRLDPATEHEVKVTTNPADAPAAVPAWSSPSIPSIDMTPLTGLSSPCTVFPFGLLCWVGEGLAQFNTTGECPSAAVPVNDEADFELTLCGDVSDQVMGYVRPAILLIFIVGCGFLFARATKAIGGD